MGGWVGRGSSGPARAQAAQTWLPLLRIAGDGHTEATLRLKVCCVSEPSCALLSCLVRCPVSCRTRVTSLTDPTGDHGATRTDGTGAGW